MCIISSKYQQIFIKFCAMLKRNWAQTIHLNFITRIHKIKHIKGDNYNNILIPIIDIYFISTSTIVSCFVDRLTAYLMPN